MHYLNTIISTADKQITPAVLGLKKLHNVGMNCCTTPPNPTNNCQHQLVVNMVDKTNLSRSIHPRRQTSTVQKWVKIWFVGHTHAHTRTYAHTHARTCTHTHVHTHMHAHTHICTHNTYAHTHKNASTHTHANTQMSAHTPAHTHVHTVCVIYFTLLNTALTDQPSFNNPEFCPSV